MTYPFEKLPPHDVEAEEAVIAASMVDPDAIYRIAPILKPSDFFREKNAWVYQACVDLWTRDEAINQITVAHELARADRLEDAGGQAYLADTIPSPAHECGCRVLRADCEARLDVSLPHQCRDGHDAARL